MTALSPLDARAVEEAILRGLWLMDHDRADEMPDSVASDVVVHGLAPQPLDRSGLVAYAQSRRANPSRRTRHVVTNLRAWGDGHDRVRSTCILAVHVLDGTPDVQAGFFGDVEDVHERAAGGGWLLVERRFVPFAVATESGP